MRVQLLALCLALAACASAPGAENGPPPFTQGQMQAAPTPAQDYAISVDAPAGVYQLDPRHASVQFRIRHMGLAWFTARFDTKDATLSFDPADPARSQLSASVTADSVNTGVEGLDAPVARALGAGAIQFASTGIERTGRFTGRVTGNLTMNGQTHPVALDVTFAGAAIDPLRGANMVLGFSAHGEIDRTQWGVNQWRAFTGDTVQIVIEAELVRRAG
ncbi:MAG: YceI family protein [Hyphomonadaceae bacterium]|nr:YceI family protein [Hyphomonadaceae bacterium]